MTSTTEREQESGVRAWSTWYLWLGLPFVVTVAGAIGVGVLADSATEGDGLAAFDPHFTAQVIALRKGWLTSIAQALTFIGNAPVLTVLTVVAAVLLRVLTKRWRSSMIIVVAMAGIAAITWLLKVLVNRHRPDVEYMLGPAIKGHAFPSGHTASGTVFFLVLGGFALGSAMRASAKAAAVVGGLLFSIGIGLSRIYLGYHWATDVLAGWLLAAAWIGVIAAGTWLLHQRTRRAGNV